MSVREGRIVFEPLLLRRVEFLAKPGAFQYFDFFGASHRLPLPPESLAFSYCQVPVIYRLGRENGITVVSADGREDKMRDLTLDAAASRSIFARAGIISRLIVDLRECPPKFL